jgi:hypothetical protein
MSARLIGGTLLLFVLPLLSIAQEKPAPAAKDSNANAPVTQAQLQEAMESLKAELIQAMRYAPSAGTNGGAPPAGAMTPLTAPPSRAEFEALKSVVFEQRKQLGQIGKAVADSGGKELWVPNLRQNMQAAPEFRQDMSQAVHDSLRQNGALRVQNRMNAGQYLTVNGKTEYIPPLATVTFDVPVGSLTTELKGFEAAKNWTIGPPNYTQEIVISPALVPPPVVPAWSLAEPAVYW